MGVDMASKHSIMELKIQGKHTAKLAELKSEYIRRTKTLLQIEEEERRSIARDIHDNLSQPLTALKINLSCLGRRNPERESLLQEKVQKALELVGSMTKAVQIISVGLRPGVLDDLGLVAAIEWLMGFFRKWTGIEYEFDVEPADISLDGQVSTAIFRILQKIVTVFAERTNATRVRISLKRKADKLYLKVVDNGEGITEARMHDRESLGLIEILERVYLLDGEVKIKGNPDGGNTITVNIPLIKEAAYD